RPPPIGTARRPRRPRPPRTAHPRRLRGQEPAHLLARERRRAPERDRRPGRRPARSRPSPRRRHGNGGGALMRHLLSAGDLDRDQATLVLDTASELAQVGDRSVKKLPTLRGRTVVNLFYEDSTRTRTSFELAAKRLSPDVIHFSAKGSSVSKG